MNEIYARKKLINQLNQEIEDMEFKSKAYEKIKSLVEDFDADHNTYYYDSSRELSDILDDDDLDYWLEEVAKDGVDRVRCFIAGTYSDDIYKLDGYNNLSNVEESDIENLVYDLTEQIKSDIEELKQSEMRGSK